MSANFDEILKLLQQYSKEELQSIFDIAMDAARPDSSKPARGKCPYCKSEHIIYFGFKNGKQRFRCKECKRTFITTTNTVMSCSHYGIDVWESMLEHTLKGYSLPFSEKELGLSHQAAFNMRHKLLLAMQDNREENPCILSDVSELDETFVLDCYKGHKLPETVTRPARKHGAKAQKRGISNEYICICTGVQRKSDVFIESVNRAKPSSDELKKVYSGHIESGTLILTDGLRSYSVLEELTDCSIKNVELEKSRFYNLNTVNNLHLFIKKRYVYYRGVATKYLNRYCAAFAEAYRYTEEAFQRIKCKLFGLGNVLKSHGLDDIRALNLLVL